MAIIRNPTELDTPINYIATLAFFCCVSCMIMMLKFRGFKASLNLRSRMKKEAEIESTTISMTGAYRVNRDEFYGNGIINDPPKKLTPSMVKLPPSFDPEPQLRNAKSTSDLVRPANLPAHVQLHKSTHDLSLDPRGGPSKGDRRSAPPMPPERKKKEAKPDEKEQKKIDKQRQAEERAREKAAAQERAKQEKQRREKEKRDAQAQAKLMKKNKKAAPQPQVNNPLAKLVPPIAPQNPPAPAYSTNTLDSSISRSSGPPPYSETANIQVTSQIGNSNPSNVSFGKPIDTTPDSWDLVSQHRQQMSRPVSASAPKGKRKNMVMDLQYKLGTEDKNENSEA